MRTSDLRRGRPARNRVWALAASAALVVSPVAAHATAHAVPAGKTTRVSVSTSEHQANGPSFSVAISGNGRFIAFASNATNLVPHDSNATRDVFVRDRVAGITTRVSVSDTEQQSDGGSRDPSVSATGRFVAFQSEAANLVPGDTNHRIDIFVRDLELGTTTLVSRSTSGDQGTKASTDAHISGDGRYVAFRSDAPNLVPGDGNGRVDVFVRDLVLETTTLVSVSTGGEQAEVGAYAPAISADGQRVVFQSYSANLVADDTNGTDDVFLHNMQSGTTRLVSLSSSEQQSEGGGYEPAISGNGRFVAFVSYGGDLVPGDTNHNDDIFVRDLRLGKTTRVSVSTAGVQGDEMSSAPSLSADGRYVGFASFASTLVPHDTSKVLPKTPGDVKDEDVFVRDRRLGTTRMVSVSTRGVQGTWGSYDPAVSASGRWIAFASYAPNLVPHDTNHTYDVFVRDQG